MDHLDQVGHEDLLDPVGLVDLLVQMESVEDLDHLDRVAPEDLLESVVSQVSKDVKAPGVSADLPEKLGSKVSNVLTSCSC